MLNADFTVKFSRDGHMLSAMITPDHMTNEELERCRSSFNGWLDVLKNLNEKQQKEQLDA